MLLAAAALLVVRCVRECRSRPLWCDEALTAYAVADPSLVHMLGGLRDEINAFPPASLVLGWGFARVLGVSEFALRIPSVLFAWMAVVLLWICLRRWLNRWVAAWCAACLPLAHPMFLFQATEARCYSLYFAAGVAAVALLLRCGEGDPRPPRGAAGGGWPVTVAHAMLVGVHYIGGLFSALLVTTALVAGFPGRDDRYRRYALHGAAGWLAAIPAVPFYLAQRKLGGEFNWIPRPGMGVLHRELSSPGSAYALFLAALSILALVVLADRGRRAAAGAGGPAPGVIRALVLLLVAQTLFIVALWVESRLALILFLDRYLFPLAAAWMVAIAFLADAIVGRLWGAGDGGAPLGGWSVAGLRVRGRALVIGAAVVLASYAALMAVTPREPAEPAVEALRAMRDRPGIPVVSTGLFFHVELGWYARGERRVVLLDDDHYHDKKIGIPICAALQRHYLPDSMKSLPECLEEFDAFLFCNPFPHLRDVEESLAASPVWRATPLGAHVTLWERHGERGGDRPGD